MNDPEFGDGMSDAQVTAAANLNANETSKVVKAANIAVKTNSEGQIVYPITITGTLKILNLGQVEWSRGNFHTGSNIFTIGFKSVRDHQSMFTIGARANYTCEILDGGKGPLFKVTCSEDPSNPIIKDTASGVWVEFCRKINETTQARKGKPSVSGPDRYGLSEPAVLRLLQSLPNVDKLENYKFRKFV